jgi:hypothetical protein
LKIEEKKYVYLQLPFFSLWLKIGKAGRQQQQQGAERSEKKRLYNFSICFSSNDE